MQPVLRPQESYVASLIVRGCDIDFVGVAVPLTESVPPCETADAYGYVPKLTCRIIIIQDD